MLDNYILICLEGSWSIVISGHSNSRKLRERERGTTWDYCVSLKCDLESGQSWLWSATSWSCCRLTGACYLTWRPPECQLICSVGSWGEIEKACPLWNCLWLPCGCNFGLNSLLIHTGYTCVKDAIGQEKRCDTYYILLHILYTTRPRDYRRKSERLTFSGNDQAGSLF